MQPFAPTPYPTGRIAPGVQLDEEIKLYTNAADRDRFDNLSAIFSILVSLEFLEKAYVRDSVPVSQYRESCARLLSQYAAGTRSIVGTPDYVSIESFCSQYKLTCPLAMARIKDGNPAGGFDEEEAAQQQQRRQEDLVVPAAPSAPPAVPKGTSAARVAETVQNFITLMDALKLSFRAKDQLHPLLSDLMTSLTEQDEETDEDVQEIPGKGRIVKWLIKINQMKVSEEISEEDARELFFEVETLYGEYLKSL